MGKSTKDRRDIYYRQGKSEGYRARSAYKLLHLNEQYGFLGSAEDYALDAAQASSSTSNNAASTSTPSTSSRKGFSTPTRVVDLCAAPGSWSQVLSRRLASVPGSHLVAVDLQAMAPLPGVTQIIGDITTPATADSVSRALSDGPCSSTSNSKGKGKAKAKARAQLIVCDGAPDVTGLHDLDEYLQSQLLLAATQITFRLLEVGGTFVAKIFTQHPQAGLSASLGNMDLKGARPATSGALLADQLRTFFDKVDIAKPRSSRVGSVEHFLVCLGFRPPQGLPAGIVGRLAEAETTTREGGEGKTEDEAREDLVRYAQKLRSQLQRPESLPYNPQPSSRELSATLPFVAHGDLSGFNQ
ncbi:related to TRM7 - tRNA 2`-O-ribose methyltransferase [Ustilago sp. UG-2017b]|nr:related to TRM7 - tRNA 2`-O-ribose methyltransferase [Ustilago sp. UG-2017b]